MADSTETTSAAAVEDKAAEIPEKAAEIPEKVAETAEKAAGKVDGAGDGKAAAEESAPPKRPSRSPEEIAAELERARQSLVGNLDALQEYVKPANVLERGTRKFRRMYVADDGSPKVKTIAITAAVIGIYVLYRIRRK